MAPIDESGELAALRERAYGPGGGITPAELSRLQELEGAPDGSPVLVAEGVGEAEDERVADDAPAPSPPDPIAVPPRRRGRTLLIVGVCTVVAAAIGFGAGALVTAANADDLIEAADVDAMPYQLQEAQQRAATQAEWDDGSLRLLGAVNSSTVWAGTTNDGQMTCVVLDVGTSLSPNCEGTEKVRSYGLRGGIILVGEEVGDVDEPFGYDANPYRYPHVTFTTK